MTRDMSGTARELALRLRTSGSVYERITKKELGELFSVGRFSEGLAQEVQDVLQEHGLACIPRVGDANVFNVFDWRHPIAKAALAIARPEDTSEGALVELVRVYQRYEQGKDLRSDDVPWIEAFDLFLQSVLYKPLRGWEDLRDDRHPAELAKDLAAALGLGEGDALAGFVRRLAAIVEAFAPLSSMAPIGDEDAALVNLLRETRERRATDRSRLLAAVAALLLGSADTPEVRVELGRIGLRRLIEGGRLA